MYVRSGSTWTQQDYLKASNSFSFDGFGECVAISGDTIVVGAPFEDSNATGVNGDQRDNSAMNAGAAYVFVRNGTAWTQQTYLQASNPELGDFFGWSAALSGDTIALGAYTESSSATGINGNQSDNSASQSGAAYVFTGICPGCPTLAIARDGSGGVFIRFTGAPDVTYRLQRAATLTGPWSTSAPQTAPADGLIEFHDLFPPPGQAFYRTVQP